MLGRMTLWSRDDKKMLGRLLLIFGSIWLGQNLIHNAPRFIKSKSKRTDSTEDKISKRTDSTEDKISTLPDDLLGKILLLLPTKDAVSTVVLSKRWRSIWTMLPELEYRDTEYKQGKKKNMWWFLNEPSLWWFLNESMKLHKAHVLETLCVQLGPGCPIDVDVIKWIADAVDRKVRKLEFKLSWLSEPIRLPDRLYVCNTLVFLTISDQILVDVPSVVCFPCLEILCLFSVVYKYEDALVRLLSGCPILKHLRVVRHGIDNLKNISVKVPSLKTLYYSHMEVAKNNEGYAGGSLAIDSPNLRKIFLRDISANLYSIENKPRLDKALIQVFSNLDDEFTKSLSSVMHLDFILNTQTVGCCYNINFSQLVECKIIPFGLHWLQPFMLFLQNSPKLKVLLIEQDSNEELPLCFNPPSSVPECLLNRLEIFEWKNYKGRNGEKELVRYLLANSECLKRVGISIAPIWSSGRVKKELKSMARLSASSQLLFSTQLKFEYSIQGETQCPFKVFIEGETYDQARPYYI